MSSNQVANDIVKFLGLAMAALFVFFFVMNIISIGEGAAEMNSLVDEHEDHMRDSIREIQEQRRENGQEPLAWDIPGMEIEPLPEPVVVVPGAFVQQTGEAAESEGGPSLLLMAGGAAVSTLAAMGAIGFLLFGGRREEEAPETLEGESGEKGEVIGAPAAEPRPKKRAPRPAAPRPQVPAEGSTAEPQFDAYGRPLDWEGEDHSAYYKQMAVTAVLGFFLLFLALCGYRTALVVGFMAG